MKYAGDQCAVALNKGGAAAIDPTSMPHAYQGRFKS